MFIVDKMWTVLAVNHRASLLRWHWSWTQVRDNSRVLCLESYECQNGWFSAFFCIFYQFGGIDIGGNNMYNNYCLDGFSHCCFNWFLCWTSCMAVDVRLHLTVSASDYHDAKVASKPKFWPQSRPQSFGLGLGLCLGLKHLASAWPQSATEEPAAKKKSTDQSVCTLLCRLQDITLCWKIVTVRERMRN